MEESKFGGEAIKALRKLVEHHEKQQERPRQRSSDFAERHGSTNSSEEEKSVP